MIQGGVGILLRLMRNLCCFEHCLQKPLDTEAVLLQHCTPCRHSVLREGTEAVESSSSSPVLRRLPRENNAVKIFTWPTYPSATETCTRATVYWQPRAHFHTHPFCRKNYCQKYNMLCKQLSHPKSFINA